MSHHRGTKSSTLGDGVALGGRSGCTSVPSRLGPLVLCAALLLSAGGLATSSDYYEWIDENGVTHYADSPDQIPAKYRDRAKPPDVERKPKAGSARRQDQAPGSGGVEPPVAAAAVKPAAAPEKGTAPARFEIPFQSHEGSSGRVIVPVSFNDSVTAPMALDTGSPGLVLSVELAERLGVFSSDAGTLIGIAGGIGGRTLAVYTLVESISIGGARDAFVPAIVVRSISPAFQGLVGMDFMSKYTMSIDAAKNVVVLQEIPSDRESRGGHPEAWWRKTFSDFRTASDAWSAYAKSIDRETDPKGKRGAEFQATQAERLLQRLEGYASDNAVPREWR